MNKNKGSNNNKPILREVRSVSWVRWSSSCPSTSFERKISWNCGNPNCSTQFATSSADHLATELVELKMVDSSWDSSQFAMTGRLSSSPKERAISLKFQTRTFLSLDPDAKSRLSWEKTQQVTYRVCPISLLMSWPVPGFHNIMLLSPALIHWNRSNIGKNNGKNKRSKKAWKKEGKARATYAEARREPSGLKRQELTFPVWPSSTWDKVIAHWRPLFTSHNLTLSSFPQEARR